MLADVKVLLDSDVLVAGVMGNHLNHTRAAPWLARASTGEVDAIVAAHSLGQVYRVLTTRPVEPRIEPTEALDLIEKSIVAPCRVEALDASGHVKCLRSIARGGVTGGTVYDGLIAEVGRTARVDKVVTFNVSDSRRVAPDLDVVTP